jgi:hypothetical protein
MVRFIVAAVGSDRVNTTTRNTPAVITTAMAKYRNIAVSLRQTGEIACQSVNVKRAKLRHAGASCRVLTTKSV